MDSPTSTVPMSEWRWFHIYHWILALHGGRFVKYNSTLHQTLRAHDLSGARLSALTRSDWLTLGVSDLGDIQILLDEVARLHKAPKDLSDSEDGDTDAAAISESESDDVAGDVECGEASEATLQSLLYENHLRQTALSNQCRHLYVYAVGLAQQLSAERAHRMMAEQALAEQAVQTQALREALSRCQSSATSVQTTMTAMAARTADLERELERLEARDAEFAALSTALSERSEELSAAKSEMAAMAAMAQQTQSKAVRLWSVDECFLWMARIDGGRFGRAYVDLYERLEVENLGGAMMERMRVEDMERIGIDDGCDQRTLLAEIRVLLQTQAMAQRGAEEEAEMAEEDEYDFADLELLSSSWGTDEGGVGGAYK